MRLELTSDKPIFRPPHKLGQVELDFVEAQCSKLEKLGFIRRSPQSQYASATVVVRKKDEEGNYTNFRQCGDYRPLNHETSLDRYPLPGIEDIFNQIRGEQSFRNWTSVAGTIRCRCDRKIGPKHHFGEPTKFCGSGWSSPLG